MNRKQKSSFCNMNKMYFDFLFRLRSSVSKLIGTHEYYPIGKHQIRQQYFKRETKQGDKPFV
jgi:hypothetical protein